MILLIFQSLSFVTLGCMFGINPSSNRYTLSADLWAVLESLLNTFPLISILFTTESTVPATPNNYLSFVKYLDQGHCKYSS